MARIVRIIGWRRVASHARARPPDEQLKGELGVCGPGGSDTAMIPGLVLFKARQISWNKEQKQGFFQQKKNK